MMLKTTIYFRKKIDFRKLIFLLALCFSLSSCDRKDDDNIPTCLNAKIELIQKTVVKTPRVTLKQYNYNNKTVYAFFNLRNPDGADTEVYDENCNLICSQGATINGTTFDTCVDWNKATLVATLWTDPR